MSHLITDSCGHWTSYQGFCYHLVTSPKSYSDAETVCESMGGNLTSIHCPFEKEFLIGKCNGQYKDTNS